MNSNSAGGGPQISVVIPCFNAARWLVHSIDSVLRQVQDGVEVVVVDDGSTDASPDILNGYGDAIVLVRQPNSGVVAARKAGVARATGKYIKFLDADDLMPPQTLCNLGDFSIRRPGEVLLGRACEVNETGALIGDEMYNIACRPASFSRLEPEFLLTQPTNSSLWFVPRSLFLTHDLFGPVETRLGEEYAFSMGIISSGACVRYVETVVSWMRVHDAETRLSNTRDEVRHLEQVRNIRAAANFIIEKIPNYSPEALGYISRLAWSRGRHCLRMDCVAAAHSYFELAQEVDADVKPVGSRFYQILCGLIGPRWSEVLLQFGKSLRKASET